MFDEFENVAIGGILRALRERGVFRGRELAVEPVEQAVNHQPLTVVELHICNGSRFIAPIEPVFATLVAGYYRAVLPPPHPLKVVLAVKGSLRRALARP